MYTICHNSISQETCVCDTENCNKGEAILDFYCHGGDYILKDIIDYPSLLNQTHSCYTNRNKCYIMRYKGSVLIYHNTSII